MCTLYSIKMLTQRPAYFGILTILPYGTSLTFLNPLITLRLEHD